MPVLVSGAVETKVEHYLLFGDLVAEVSKGLVVSRIWERKVTGAGTALPDFAGKKIAELPLDHILYWSVDCIESSIHSRQNISRELFLSLKEGEGFYSIRVLNNHPDPEYLFVVAEKLPERNPGPVNQVGRNPSAQLLLETQRNFYENILNHIDADVVVFDSEFRFLYVNPVAIKNEELRRWIIGKTDADFCRLRNRPLSIAESRTAQYRKAVAQRRILEFEERSVKPDGEVVYHLRRIWPLYLEDGSLDIMVGYGLNITERVLAREALQLSQEIFTNAFEHSGIGMALVSPDGRWLEVNSALCHILGYDKEELLKCTFQDITHPADIDLDVAILRKMHRKEIRVHTTEKRYVKKDLKIVWVLLTVSLVVGNDGSPRFFVSQLVDITRQKNLENELAIKNTELETSIRSLNSKVNQLEELSFIIAHNLRGPAGNIKSLAEHMREHAAAGYFIQTGHFENAISLTDGIRYIEESSAALLSSLETLMNVAAIKLNRNVEFDNCDLSAVIESVSNQLQSQIFEKHAIITSDIEVPEFSYPRVYLENIMYNLLSNALKYSRPGVPPQITISQRKLNERITISVKDNGLGLDLEKYGDRIFKLNQVFHKGFDSKGFGLYLTKTQIESLGGYIQVISNVNEGSEFVVTL